VAAEIAQANPHLSPSESRAICGAMMFTGDLARKKISVLSGGEQSRVLLGKILAHPANLLLLDEPSNHLDMDAIEVLTQEIKKFPGGVVIVTHNEEMLRVLANKLVIFHENRAEFFPGTYDEFLETIGWEEESSLEKTKEKSLNKHSKPEDAGPAKKQTRELKSLKKDYENMESEILKLEDGLKNKNEEVLRMVQERGDVSQIQELYKTIGKMQSRIDDCYSQMEELFRQGATP